MLKHLFSLIFCCFAVSFADQSIDGTIVNSQNQPVANAYVYLKNAAWPAFYTGADGKFILTESSGVISGTIKKGGMGIRPVGSGECICLSFDGRYDKAKVEMFNGAGRKVYSKSLDNKKSMEQTITFDKMPQCLYLIKVSYGPDTKVFKVAPGIGASGFLTKKGDVSGKKLLEKRNAVFTDSVVVVCRSYRNALIGVENYETHGLQVQLSSSNPWKPSSKAELEHSGAMVKIKAKGYDFEMGQSFYEKCGDLKTINEKPVHTVYFTYDFWMDTTEVTQGNYDSVMSSVYPKYIVNKSRPYGIGPNYPMYELYWGGAALYCNARSKLEGLDTAYAYDSTEGGKYCSTSKLKGFAFNASAKGYRLPTEAEWEYACRGGTFTDYFWGRNYPDYLKDTSYHADFDSFAVYYNNSYVNPDPSQFGAHEVGKLMPNLYGLYDIVGNVEEICHDTRDAYHYGAVTDPFGTIYIATSYDRGGNWSNQVELLRSANRQMYQPDYPYWYIGMRPVRVVK